MQNDSNVPETKIISYSNFFKNKRVVLVLISVFSCSVALMFLEPILTPQLETLGVSDKNVGWGFAAQSFAFAVGSPISGVICRQIDRRLVIFTSLFLVGLVLLLVGPSEQFLLPKDSVMLVLIGLILLGLFSTGVLVSSVPEVIQVMY